MPEVQPRQRTPHWRLTITAAYRECTQILPIGSAADPVGPRLHISMHRELAPVPAVASGATLLPQSRQLEHIAPHPAPSGPSRQPQQAQTGRRAVKHLAPTLSVATSIASTPFDRPRAADTVPVRMLRPC